MSRHRRPRHRPPHSTEDHDEFPHSQPRETLRVVVGGYVSDQNDFNSFTAAVLLDCPDFEKVACWSLEKLSLNGRIVLDRKRIRAAHYSPAATGNVNRLR